MTKVPMVLVALAVTAAAAAGCARDEQAAAPAAPTTMIAAPGEDAEQTITQLEHDWVAAIVNKDPATIERLLADDFLGATDDTVYGKPVAIEDVKFGSHQLEMSDLNVRVYGDAAVTTFEQTETSTHGDESFTGHYRFTNVWVRTDDGWRAVASHGSRIR